MPPGENMAQWLETPAPGDVRITDNFWKPKIDLNREVTIPYVFRQCEETGRIDNFAIAGRTEERETHRREIQ